MRAFCCQLEPNASTTQSHSRAFHLYLLGWRPLDNWKMSWFFSIYYQVICLLTRVTTRDSARQSPRAYLPIPPLLSSQIAKKEKLLPVSELKFICIVFFIYSYNVYNQDRKYVLLLLSGITKQVAIVIAFRVDCIFQPTAVACKEGEGRGIISPYNLWNCFY